MASRHFQIELSHLTLVFILIFFAAADGKMLTQLKVLLLDALETIPWETRLQPTLPAKCVPRVLHEPAILSGYRVPNRSWKYYIYSVFQLHNETVNVWTHLIGACVILHQLHGYFLEFDLATDGVLSTLFAFGITCIVGLTISAVVHLLHSKSPHIHFVAFMTDYIGATVCSFGTGVGAFYGVSEPYFYRRWENWYIPATTVVSYLNFVNLCLAKLWFGDDPHNLKRKYMFIVGMSLQGLLNVAPFIPRYINCFYEGTCEIASLHHLTLICIVFVLEAVAFAAHQPEKTWPGKFDIVGHGHQIFHILIVVNHVLQLNAVYSDYKAGIMTHTDPSVVYIFSFLIGMLAFQFATLKFLSKFVPYSLAKVKDM